MVVPSVMIWRQLSWMNWLLLVGDDGSTVAIVKAYLVENRLLLLPIFRMMYAFCGTYLQDMSWLRYQDHWKIGDKSYLCVRTDGTEVTQITANSLSCRILILM